jgi:hypothetical protein
MPCRMPEEIRGNTNLALDASKETRLDKADCVTNDADIALALAAIRTQLTAVVCVVKLGVVSIR